ncbi:MAG: hypothetical protein K0S23_1147 [Fluviicola sp.]|jgi:hypothetical protein|nr:hypothetical protein [Fluviicola sp.]
MKNLILGVSAIALLGLASCKKDRNCECTYQDTGNTTIIENKAIKNATLKDAKRICDDYESSGFTKTCTLQ